MLIITPPTREIVLTAEIRRETETGCTTMRTKDKGTTTTRLQTTAKFYQREESMKDQGQDSTSLISKTPGILLSGTFPAREKGS